MKKSTVIEISEQDLTDIINKHYGTALEGFVAMEELSNEVITRDVSPAKWDDVDDIAEFKRRDFKHYILTDLLDDLCFEGVIEEGEYLIDCTW